jgi:hypothetical protein
MNIDTGALSRGLSEKRSSAVSASAFSFAICLQWGLKSALNAVLRRLASGHAPPRDAAVFEQA